MVDWFERLRARILIPTEIYAGINTKANIALFPMRLGIYPTGGGNKALFQKRKLNWKL
jgi:hypothetical protein